MQLIGRVDNSTSRDLKCMQKIIKMSVLLDFSLTVKAVTLIFISGRASAISSAKEGK